jgi:hypothetical protein
VKSLVIFVIELVSFSLQMKGLWIDVLILVKLPLLLAILSSPVTVPHLFPVFEIGNQ